MHQGDPIRIFRGAEGGFVHQPPDGEVGHHQQRELLPDQIRCLAAQNVRAPRRWVLSSSNAVSISQRW